MDDLSLALSEHGVNVKKPDYCEQLLRLLKLKVCGMLKKDRLVDTLFLSLALTALIVLYHRSAHAQKVLSTGTCITWVSQLMHRLDNHRFGTMTFGFSFSTEHDRDGQ
jgi:hypothetical protein